MSRSTAVPRSAPVQSAPRILENAPNAKRTMEALRSMGYDSYSSILDLIDNAIDAQAMLVKVSISHHRDDIIITIEDDGSGMDETTLSEALRLGSDSPREAGDLGKFGMGLVTASIGLAQRVEVLTKEVDGPVLFGAFDLEQIATENRFLKELGDATLGQVSEFSRAKGTCIKLSRTDRISNRNVTEFANRLRNRVGQVFRKFLKAELRIEVNGKAAEPYDPLMLSHPDTQLVLETELECDGQGKAYLRAVDVPDHGAAGNTSLGIIPQNSGFYIVRNNREILEAETFDFYKKHPDFSHFRAELSFDGTLDSVFQVDIKKMSIHLPQGFLDKLKQATMGLITASGRQSRKRKNISAGQIDHSVAEANITRRAPLIPKPKALIEKRQPRVNNGSHPTGDGRRSRTPHITHLKTISGLRVVFHEGDYSDQGPFYLVQQEGRTITVTYNREHLFWRELVEHADSPKVIAILDYLVFALANSELLVPEQAAIVKQNVNSTLVGLLV